MSKPCLLDLCCCAGGAAVGYARAGFEVVGIDLEPQPDYPYEFIQVDALTFPLEGFDAYHASPTCKQRVTCTSKNGRVWTATSEESKLRKSLIGRGKKARSDADASTRDPRATPGRQT